MQKRTLIVILVVVAATALGIGLFLWHISKARIVARVVTPDGLEMCIVQRCNWNAEPFTTSFIYRKPGAAWRRSYYDHQDNYWGSGRAALDTNAKVAVFYRGGSPAVTFAWATETYTLHRWNRTVTNADEMPAGWSP